MNVTDSFFQQKPDIKPIIYAYELVGVESHRGWGNRSVSGAGARAR